MPYNYNTQKKWRENNVEKRRTLYKNWSINNRERRNIQKKESYHKNKYKVKCPHCNKEMLNISLKRHIKLKHSCSEI
jgi:Zn finger protein HypA/HybF involved in hydrogenase expression